MGTFGICTLDAGELNGNIEAVIVVNRFITPADMNLLTNIRLYVHNHNAGSVSVRACVYADATGAPAAKLLETSGQTLAGQTLAQLDFGCGLVLNASVAYWFGGWSTTYAGAGVFLHSPQTYVNPMAMRYWNIPPLPNPFGTPDWTTTEDEDICLTYSAVAVARAFMGDGLAFLGWG